MRQSLPSLSPLVAWLWRAATTTWRPPLHWQATENRKDTENDIRATTLSARARGRQHRLRWLLHGRTSLVPANITAPVARGFPITAGAPMSSVVPRNAPRPCCSSGRDRTSSIGSEHRQKVAEGMQASKHPSVQSPFPTRTRVFCDQRSGYNPAAAKAVVGPDPVVFEQYLDK